MNREIERRTDSNTPVLQRGGSFGCLARECGVAWCGVTNLARA